MTGFSYSPAYYPSPALDKYGYPYVAYTDMVNSAKATVMKKGSIIDITQPPAIAANTDLTVDECANATIDSGVLKATDSYVDDGTFVFTITTATTNGEVQLSGSATMTFTQADIDAGNVTYVHNGGETTGDNFTFSVSDVSEILSGQTFDLTISPVSDVSVNTTAPALSGTATEDESLSVNNGIWTDDDGDALTFTYQWYFDTDGADYDGTAITDATDSTFRRRCWSFPLRNNNRQ